MLKVKNNRGFSLIEITIGILIMGFILGTGIVAYSAMIKRDKEKSIKEFVESEVLSFLEGYINTVSCIPAPEINPNPSSRFSQNLLPEGYVKTKDTLNNELRVFYASYVYKDNNPSITGKECDNSDGQANICSLAATDMKIRFCKEKSISGNCSNYEEINNVVFAIVSGGVNRNVQVKFDETSKVLTVYMREDAVDGYSKDLNSPQGFDDIVYYRKLEQLRTFCKGKNFEVEVQNLSRDKYILIPRNGVVYDYNPSTGSRDKVGYELSVSSPCVSVNPPSSFGDWFEIDLSGCPAGSNITVTVRDRNEVVKNFWQRRFIKP